MATDDERFKELFDSRNEHASKLVAIEKDVEVVRTLAKDTKRFVENGLGDRIASIVKQALVEHQEKEWQREHEDRKTQLEEYKAANARMGAQKDIEQRRRDRNMKLFIGVMPVIVILVNWIFSQVGG